MDKSELSDEMRTVYEEITALTDRVCESALNEEYAELSLELAAVLAAFSNSPLGKGKREIWACGIVYALGQINFLFDTDRSPYLSAEGLCKAFGVKQSSAYQKALRIRKALDMFPMEPRWTLPSMQDENPYNWMIEVDGLIVDARYAPRDLQEIAYEKGLIPYIPEGKKENPYKIDTIEVSDDEELKEASLRLEAENPRDKKKRKQQSTEPDPSQLSLDMDI